MGRKKYIERLEQYARRTGSALKFEEVADSAERFIYWAVINGEYIANGVGEDKEEAKKNAAKIALRNLSGKENQKPVNTTPKPNHRSLLNDYAQKKRIAIKIVETPRTPSPCCSYVVGGTKYPSASGKTKKEAKEEAAKLAYHEINDSRTAEVPCSTLCEAGEQPSSPRRRPEFSDGESTKTNITTATSHCVSSNHPKTQGADLDEKSTGNSHSVTLIRNKSEFDSIEHLGKGGFGYVVKARDKLLDKFFAIKIIPCGDIKKALREVQALCELDHSNVIRCFSSWMDDTGCTWDSADDTCSTSESDSSQATRFLYIQMDLCDTKTLKAWIDECNTLGVKKSLPNSKRRIKGLDIVHQMVHGLEYIHSKMFIHRDLKPSNILFKGERTVKIADFSLVTTERNHNDENMEFMGKTYMAPEQKFEKTYNHKVDIFALGLIYFEIIWQLSTGHERGVALTEMGQQTFPKEFLDYYYSEYMIIRPMLSVKPEDRPEANSLKTKLEEFKSTLDTENLV